MKKNEVNNFIKSYRNTICLDENLRPVKLIDAVEQDMVLYFVIWDDEKTRKVIETSRILIPLKDRLKTRDYDFVSTQYHSRIANK